MNAIESIRERLNACKGTWPKVCEDTGLDYSWLTKFAQGKIPNPGYAKVSVLHDHFRMGKRKAAA